MASFLLFLLVYCAPLNDENKAYNLNQKQTENVLEYEVNWQGHNYHASPTNWRFPFYSLMMDRFADGDPINNDIHGAGFSEYDPLNVNFNFGGDTKGVIARLDYLYDLGIRGIYLAGTPFLNRPWDWHQYNPIDLTVLDPHRGTVEEWREMIAEIHARNMNVIIDLTIETLGDLTYFEGYLNKSTPLNMNGYPLIYRSENLKYADFKITNNLNPKCDWPNFYDYETGYPVVVDVPEGCYDDDFAHYGDLEAFGNYKAWERQITKFSGVQDRLRDWSDSVAEKLIKLTCLVIEGLDIDGIRVDKATQMTMDFATKVWSAGVRKCASALGKDNFFIPGEITTGINFGTMYIGRGRLAHQRPTAGQFNFKPLPPGYFYRTEYGLDSEAFHYSIYRNLLYLIGLRGQILVENDVSWDPVEAWNQLLLYVDYFNSKTTLFDPRDMYGVSNQDTFRWASLTMGEERLRLGLFIITLVLPGIPLVNFGDEQSFYLHDSRSENYIYGRQPMSTSRAWQLHGCFTGKASYQFVDMPFSEKSRNGCRDDTQSMDHFNRFSPMYLWLQRLLYIRSNEQIFQEGFELQTLFKFEVGQDRYVWSVERKITQMEGTTRSIWMIFTNSDENISIEGGCGDGLNWSSPFVPDTKINLLLGNGDYTFNQYETGIYCLDTLNIGAFGFLVFSEIDVPLQNALQILGVNPSHDASLDYNSSKSIEVELMLSDIVQCNIIISAIKVQMHDESTVEINDYECVLENNIQKIILKLVVPKEGLIKFNILKKVFDDTGINIISGAQWSYRVGNPTNIITFPKENEFSEILEIVDNNIIINHNAEGANKFRYSLDYGKTWTLWKNYEDITPVPRDYFDDGNDYRVEIQYWSEALASASFHTISMLSNTGKTIKSENMNRYPSFQVLGEFNKFGYDRSINSKMKRKGDQWIFLVPGPFPANISVDVWGDNSLQFGDVDSDWVLDRLPPSSQDSAYLYFPSPPTSFNSWILTIDDRTLTWHISPAGSWAVGLAYFITLAVVPIVCGILVFHAYRYWAYLIKINKKGRDKPVPLQQSPILIQKQFPSILMATLEYEIPDWEIKVRIGGLGVIASLASQRLPNQIHWVVPKVSGVKYPLGEPYDDIIVKIMGQEFKIKVTIHIWKNVIFYLLESSIFLILTKSCPYPSRMDDFQSAVFYSCWNQAIAAILLREDIDVYHINDFHGAIAHFHLLPIRKVPCVVSLHNAEYQGLWPIRNNTEKKLICDIFNISPTICDKFIQLGHSFNLLHAVSNYVTTFQQGNGCGGVSVVYGERCRLRYPALWNIKKMCNLENPNPQDFGNDDDALEIFRTKDQKIEIQNWANLALDTSARLLVFLGRFSFQKGIDLVADLAPILLRQYPDIQILCVGPVIDIFGRFAAIKLQKISAQYPQRVRCIPVYTVVPKSLFYATDYVLIPSRDEPFGLVAVEFGRAGAIAIGSNVGGLGQMPGYWYSIESSSTQHLISQFHNALNNALSTNIQPYLRVIGSRQRFPVEIWVENVQKAYNTVTKYDSKSSDYFDIKHTFFQQEHENVTELNAAEYVESYDKDNKNWSTFPIFTDSFELRDLFEEKLIDLDEENTLNTNSIANVIENQSELFYRNALWSRTENRLREPGVTIGQQFALKLVNKVWMTWPVYCWLILFGQILCSASLQLILIVGDESNNVQYILDSMVVIGTIIWAVLCMKVSSVVVISFPFLLLAISLLTACISIIQPKMTLLAAATYSLASSASPFLYALNFGEEVSSQILSWIIRATVGEVMKHILVIFGWYFQTKGIAIQESGALLGVLLMLSFLCILSGCLLYFGAPECYRYSSPRIPNFFKSLFRRRLVTWFLLGEGIKTYVLSGVYGRNWLFLWSQPLGDGITIGAILFFEGILICSLLLIGRKSDLHSFFLPIVAVGLLSPRWAQLSYSISLASGGIQWAGKLHYLYSLSLWLLLGVLDVIQAIGFAVMLMQTLTRFHLVATLSIAQILAASVKMIANATTPDDTPSRLFPNVTVNDLSLLHDPLFVAGLGTQILYSLGFLIWFRQEQLSKP